ncbi:MAG: hypothetical protein MJK04_21945 [Psychrosphaera sp.]|nr:hypothetical protein [Psychrosphaera sp.]
MNKLIELLVSCEALLRSVGEEHWANKIKCALARAKGPAGNNSLQGVFSWYGGMGSFNDVLICVENGHVLKGRNEGVLNYEFRRLKEDIYDQLQLLKAD